MTFFDAIIDSKHQIRFDCHKSLLYCIYAAGGAELWHRLHCFFLEDITHHKEERSTVWLSLRLTSCIGSMGHILVA